MTDVTARPRLLALPDHELDGVVEHRGVAAGVVDHGPQDVLVQERTLAQPALAAPHPVHVARDRVDLSVVAEHPEGLGPLPRGFGVG